MMAMSAKASFRWLAVVVGVASVIQICMGQGNQNLNCWALLSGKKGELGGVRIADGVPGDRGANRFGNDFNGDGRIPQSMARPGLLLMETATYRAVLVAPEFGSSHNFRTGGVLEVTMYHDGKTIGPIPLNKQIPSKYKKDLEAAGVNVWEKRVVNGGARRNQLKFPDGDRVAADVNPDGQFGAMVLTEKHSPMVNGVCGGPKYLDTSKNVKVVRDAPGMDKSDKDEDKTPERVDTPPKKDGSEREDVGDSRLEELRDKIESDFWEKAGLVSEDDLDDHPWRFQIREASWHSFWTRDEL